MYDMSFLDTRQEDDIWGLAWEVEHVEQAW